VAGGAEGVAASAVAALEVSAVAAGSEAEEGEQVGKGINFWN
jgi:hypothetical protein